MNNDVPTDSPKVLMFKDKQTKEQEKNKDILKQKLKALHDKINIDNSTAYFAISFDENELPEIVFGGNVDGFKMVGILDFCKDMFKDNIKHDLNDEDGYVDYE